MAEEAGQADLKKPRGSQGPRLLRHSPTSASCLSSVGRRAGVGWTERRQVPCHVRRGRRLRTANRTRREGTQTAKKPTAACNLSQSGFREVRRDMTERNRKLLCEHPYMTCRNMICFYYFTPTICLCTVAELRSEVRKVYPLLCLFLNTLISTTGLCDAKCITKTITMHLNQAPASSHKRCPP